MKAAVISPSLSVWWKVGAVGGASGVALGAFGAHALKDRVKDPKLLKNWTTASQYQLIHSVALLVTPMCRRPNVAGGLLATGTLLFSGSLYVMTLTGEKRLGALTVGNAMNGGFK
ncbi:hypothetical protein PsorP6_014842 [Peronosclerospora sorghi]|uniref:Uncharacterized protein n=1 Tax=Peronosclerospora sorghi TaxID=230839 RepID=A0ACC0VSY2_9STRA|nr:hypothetical protein PsorP6_014842 [Peronosclerospora sorghi]